MITKQAYYDDVYKTELSTKVVGITDKGVILDSTIAYPEGGGQPGDRGAISGFPFSDTQLIDGEIVHIIKKHNLQVGDECTLTLDWAHRYFYMKEHTAQHMLSGLMFTQFQIGTVSVHQGEEILTVETDRMDIPEDILFSLEDLVNEKIREGHEISYISHLKLKEAEDLHLRRSIKVAADVRIVNIEGVDQIACGGLHVKNTAEIGEICFVGTEQIRGHVRTIWRVSDKAKAKRRLDSAIALEVGQLLSATGEKVVPALKKLIENKEKADAEVRELNKKLAEITLSKSEKVFLSPVPCAYYTDLLNSETFILYRSVDKANWLYYGSAFDKIKEIGKVFSIKGGGREPLFQGMVNFDKAEEFLYAVKGELK